MWLWSKKEQEQPKWHCIGLNPLLYEFHTKLTPLQLEIINCPKARQVDHWFLDTQQTAETPRIWESHQAPPPNHWPSAQSTLTLWWVAYQDMPGQKSFWKHFSNLLQTQNTWPKKRVVRYAEVSIFNHLAFYWNHSIVGKCCMLLCTDYHCSVN